jgi:trans-aconitate 2-methyltransferase
VSWNPAQYEKFKDERKRPFHDLLALVEPRARMRVVDLGCGTGEGTRELHQQLEARETIGVDNSAEMLRKSDGFAGGGLRFERGDIEAFKPDQPFDLIFSNAAFHWVADHESLYRRLAGDLTKEGQIAVQIPAQDEHPSHAIAADVAREMGISPRKDHLLKLEGYATLLHELGFKRQHVRAQIYGHHLESSRAVVEWVRGTLLVDYEKQLGARYPQFLEEYTKRLVAKIGDVKPYFYTYRRILMWGSYSSASMV